MNPPSKGPQETLFREAEPALPALKWVPEGIITKKSEFQPVAGPYEPWYVTEVEAETDKVIQAFWRCPHCGLLFRSRNACESHCKGKPGSFPPTCSALKKRVVNMTVYRMCWEVETRIGHPEIIEGDFLCDVANFGRVIDVWPGEKGIDMIKFYANERQKSAIKNERPSAHGCKERDPITLSRNGCAGEFALAIVTQLIWHVFAEKLRRKGKVIADVGARLEIRSSHHRDPHLLVHETDRNERPFVLGIVERDLSKIRLAGWLYGKEAKKIGEWKALEKDRPCYCVPQGLIHPMSELEEWQKSPKFVQATGSGS